METAGIGQSLMVIVGPILLAIVLIWALMRNRRAGGRDRTEQATHDLYDAQDRQDKAEDNRVQR